MDPARFIKKHREKAVKLHHNHVNKSRSERLMEVQNAAVDRCLKRSSDQIDDVTRAKEWDRTRAEKPKRVFFDEKFTQIRHDFGEHVYKQLVESVKTEVKECLVAWGFRTVQVDVVRDDLLSEYSIEIHGLIKSLMHDTETNPPSASTPAPRNPPAVRTGLVEEDHTRFRSLSKLCQTFHSKL